MALFQNLLISKYHLAEKIGTRVQATKITTGDLVETPGLIDVIMGQFPDTQVIRQYRAPLAGCQR